MCLGYSLGIDYIRYSMVLLRYWVVGMVICASQKIKDKGNSSSTFLAVLISLLVALVLRFTCMDYLLFYICFESSLIPTLILILGWGYQPERVQAGLYILFYTLFISLPLLISFLSLYKYGGTLVIGEIRLEGLSLTSHI